MRRHVAIPLFLRLAASLALILPASSCIRDHGGDIGYCPFVSDIERSVVFKVATPYATIHGSGTRAIGETQEQTIETLDVLAFDITGGGDRFLYWAEAEKDENNIEGSRSQSFHVKLRVAESSQRFVFLANARPQVLDLIGSRDDGFLGVEKESMLSQLTFDLGGSDRWNASDPMNYTPIPMWGESGPKIIGETTTSIGPDAVPLIRMVARVGVQLDVANYPELTSQFKLKSVRVHNTSTSGRIVPAGGKMSGTLAVYPSLPELVATDLGPLLYTDFSEPGVEDVSMLGAIYLFERDNKSRTDYLGRSCIVVGGLYGTDTYPTYYRLDYFAVGGEEIIDILRNHEYVFNINKISGRGYPTPEDAFRFKPFNMEAQVIAWNQADVAELVYNGQYFMSVSKAVFELGTGRYGTASRDNKLHIRTDFPDGWQIESISDSNSGEDITWLTVNDDERTGTDKTISLRVAANDEGVRRTANIRITAGPMSCIVTLAQDTEYGGGHADLLYFAAGGVLATGTWASMDESARTNLAFFKYGSVVGFTNTVSQYDPVEVTFNPTSTMTYSTWDAIPSYAAADFTAGQTNVSLTGTNNYHTGDNVKLGKGDPCRLVGLTTTAIRNMSAAEIDSYRSGWRMPTLAEDIDFMNVSTDYYNGGSTAVISSVAYPYWDHGPADETDGGWFPIIGRRDSEKGRGPLNSDPDGYIPSRGWRGADGTLDMFATFYWPSSEAASATMPYGTQGTIDHLSPAITSVPAAYGTMRRCIRDGELGVTVYPPVLLHMSNTLPSGTGPAAKIDVEGGTFTITSSTNLQGWGVKVFEGTGHTGTPLITIPADPEPGIAPQTIAVESSVTIDIPENNTAEAERPLTFVLYCTEYPGTGNEVVIGTWRQHKYYTLTVADSDHGSVALSQQPAAGKAGYRYGTYVTLTPTTDDEEHFFHGWTAQGITLTPWQSSTKPLTISLTADTEATPLFAAVLDHGVRFGDLVWANYNLAMPHAFAVSHLSADVKLYQNYYPNRAPIAWPSSGTINSSNPGYDMATGAAVNAWQSTGYPTTISLWPTAYDQMPCPEGWVVPTLAHWENLRDNATYSRVPATGTITGYNYTNSSDQSIYLPLSPRRNWNNTDYDEFYPQYMMSATDTDTNGRDWSIATNAQTANGTSYVGAGRVIRCVRPVAQ